MSYFNNNKKVYNSNCDKTYDKIIVVKKTIFKNRRKPENNNNCNIENKDLFSWLNKP